jgi:hypothetical protein
MLQIAFVIDHFYLGAVASAPTNYGSATMDLLFVFFFAVFFLGAFALSQAAIRTVARARIYLVRKAG